MNQQTIQVQSLLWQIFSKLKKNSSQSMNTVLLTESKKVKVSDTSKDCEDHEGPGRGNIVDGIKENNKNKTHGKLYL